mmetsp:Transcript_137079/g.193944  ORF Transcript_137079/g.193944 Transcript_137079/m.193944 type:complete len:87 (-) Transcript_137079:144-404(-)
MTQDLDQFANLAVGIWDAARVHGEVPALDCRLISLSHELVHREAIVAANNSVQLQYVTYGLYRGPGGGGSESEDASCTKGFDEVLV